MQPCLRGDNGGVTRRRTLAQQIVLGFGVCALAIVGAAVLYVAGQLGVDAVSEGRSQDAIIFGGIALGSAMVPVITLAVFLHWMGVTERIRSPRAVHVPSLAEDILLGLAVVVVLAGGALGTKLSYVRAQTEYEAGDYALAVGFAVLGLTAVAFMLFCVARYFRWLRS